VLPGHFLDHVLVGQHPAHSLVSGVDSILGR